MNYDELKEAVLCCAKYKNLLEWQRFDCKENLKLLQKSGFSNDKDIDRLSDVVGWLTLAIYAFSVASASLDKLIGLL